MVTDAAIFRAFRAALNEARRFVGATAPNPPVGAAAIDASGAILGVHAHVRAGTAHAEAGLIQALRDRGALENAHTLVVTLEPCNHQGRTPPCTETIVAAGIRRVIYGVADPNPKVAGGGAAALALRGIGVRSLAQMEEDEARELSLEAARLIGPFAKWARTGLPWITLKRAFTAQGSMIPPAGQKTFTSESSLRFAHELRRRADAILTGSGTILADRPEFTVRLVPDHAEKRRKLVYLDRRGRVPADWVRRAETLGFEVHRHTRIEDALKFVGKNNGLEVLVEAGPELSETLLRHGLWDESVVIVQGNPDRIETTLKPSGA